MDVHIREIPLYSDEDEIRAKAGRETTYITMVVYRGHCYNIIIITSCACLYCMAMLASHLMNV